MTYQPDKDIDTWDPEQEPDPEIDDRRTVDGEEPSTDPS